MKTEKHIIKGHFKGKRPHVKVTAYELSAVDCSADKMSGYYSQETTLISDDPEPGYDFAGWSVTGSNVTGNNVRFEGDITAKANYSAHVYNVTLQNDGHGTIAADKTTGNLGDTITLSNSPNDGYNFSGYSITGATLTSNQFKFNTNDVTAKAWFTALPTYTLTLQNDGHGSINATKLTGRPGDTVTLSNNHNTYYRFSGYSQTGGSLNGSTFTFGSQNATAKAWFSANKFTVSGVPELYYSYYYGLKVNYASNNAPTARAPKGSTAINASSGNNMWYISGAVSGYNLHFDFTRIFRNSWGGTGTRTARCNYSFYQSTALQAKTYGFNNFYNRSYTATNRAAVITANHTFNTSLTGTYFMDRTYLYNQVIAETAATWSATGYAP